MCFIIVAPRPERASECFTAATPRGLIGTTSNRVLRIQTQEKLSR
jgi:hypothetical protein